MQVYADHAATTKMRPEAIAAMVSCMQTVYGNPSSLHSMGRQARTMLEKSRKTVADCLGCHKKEIFFNSGGTESDHQAILTGAYLGREKGKMHLITSAFEHPAVLKTMEKLQKEGFSVTYLPVDPETHNIAVSQVRSALREDTCLVSLMYANNEIGSVLPIRQVGQLCRSENILFHVDAVQAVGHIPVDVEQDNIDLLSLSAHKFGGPRGVGALYARKEIAPYSIFAGGGQERGKRPGTENLPGICAMAAALKKAVEEMDLQAEKTSQLRDLLIQGISYIPGSHLNGDRVHRLPGNINFSFEGLEGETLLVLLDNQGICASAGSACSSGSLEPSHVLLAAGRSRELARGSIRLSLSDDNSLEEVNYILKVLPQAIMQLRTCL